MKTGRGSNRAPRSRPHGEATQDGPAQRLQCDPVHAGMHASALPASACLLTKPNCSPIQNPRSRKSDCPRAMIRRTVMPFTARTDPEPSSRSGAGPGTVRLALLERTAGRRRQCRCCRSVASRNARIRGQAKSVCTPCAQAMEDDAHQPGTAPALLRRCLICRIDIALLRAGDRTCGDARKDVRSRLLRGQRCSLV